MPTVAVLPAVDPVADPVTTNRPSPSPLDTGDSASNMLWDSPVARAWMEKEGVTRADIETAQSRLREAGYPEQMLNDPGFVRQYLPRRNIPAVHIHRLTLPARASAGEPIPFSLSGAYPDASFTFTHFAIVRQDDRIRIIPMGNTSAEPVPGVEIPVDLDGEIDPLPPGVYHVEFPEHGPVGSYELIVE